MNFVFRIIMLFSVFIVGFICFIRGQYYAKFFLIGWFIFLVTTIIWVLCLNGVIQFNFITSYIQILGLVIQTLFLSFALVDRYQLLRKKVLTANDKLKKANAQLIHVFGITVEARDIYTAGHQFRVSGLAEYCKTNAIRFIFIENVKLSAIDSSLSYKNNFSSAIAGKKNKKKNKTINSPLIDCCFMKASK